MFWAIDIIDIMSQLIVRNLDPEIVRLLRERAAKHGRSAEAEHREILKQALTAPDDEKPLSFKEHLFNMPNVGDDSIFARQRGKKAMPRRVRF